MAKYETGSSPRTWGTLDAELMQRLDDRFIPTHVGNAAGTSRTRTCGSVHPHARGERSTRPASCSRSHGSSPRTWGTLFNLSRRRWNGNSPPSAGQKDQQTCSWCSVSARLLPPHHRRRPCPSPVWISFSQVITPSDRLPTALRDRTPHGEIACEPCCREAPTNPYIMRSVARDRIETTKSAG